jgi:hypothetical protein
MIAGLLTGIATSPSMLAALRYGVIALAVLLFLLSLRRSGDERDASPSALKLRRGPMTFNAGCWKRRLAVLAITTSLLNGCGTVRSEEGRLATCPPVVEYGREFQTRAAEELARLPEGSAVVVMLADSP